MNFFQVLQHAFIEKIHFGENAPENHNICVYEDNKWITIKNDIIDDLITKKYNLSKCIELEELKQINNKIVKNFE